MSETNIIETRLNLTERNSLTQNDTQKNKNMVSSTRNIIIEPIEIYNWFGFRDLHDLYKHMESSVGYDK